MAAGASTLLETVRVRGGRVPLWPHHEARLHRSAAALGVVLPEALDPPSGGADRVCRLEFPGRGRQRSTERRVEPVEALRLRTALVPHRGYRHKTADRAWLDGARLDAAALGADDVLFVTEEGWVAESSIWSLFWWEGGRLAAPPLALGILPGVARVRLAELAGGIEEQRVSAGAFAASVPFAANAARGVVPIVELDGVSVPPNGATEALAGAFWP